MGGVGCGCGGVSDDHVKSVVVYHVYIVLMLTVVKVKEKRVQFQSLVKKKKMKKYKTIK